MPYRLQPDAELELSPEDKTSLLNFLAGFLIVLTGSILVIEMADEILASLEEIAPLLPSVVMLALISYLMIKKTS